MHFLRGRMRKLGADIYFDNYTVHAIKKLAIVIPLY